MPALVCGQEQFGNVCRHSVAAAGFLPERCATGKFTSKVQFWGFVFFMLGCAGLQCKAKLDYHGGKVESMRSRP